MAYFGAPIRSRIDPEFAKKLYDDGLTDQQIATVFCVTITAARDWRQANKLPPNHPKQKEKEDYLADTKQCEKCKYWGDVHHAKAGLHFCHHLLETGKRRVQVDGVCMSQKKRRGK
jgi:hypothetical protein